MDKDTKDYIIEIDRWLLWKQRWDSIDKDEKEIIRIISDETKGNFVFSKK